MHLNDIKRINVVAIVLGVGLSCFACKPSSQTAQENQPPATPQPSETFLIPQVDPTLSTPQPSQTLPTPQANPTPPTPQAYQTFPVPQAYQMPSIPQAYQTPSTPQTYQTPSKPQTYQKPSTPQTYQTPSTPPAHQPPSIPTANQTRPTPPVNQAANTTNQGLKNLPDGDYFYGELPEANSTGRKYLVFRKTGNLITGQEYVFQSDHSNCFRGTADVNSIANVNIAYLEPSRDGAKWSFSERDSIKTSDLHRLNFERIPDFATRNLRECINLFANRT